MSFNILDMVKDHLTDQVMDSIGNAIGGNASQTSSALGGALPGLLSSFLDAGSSSSGADALFTAVNDQDDSILDNLGDLLGGSNVSNFASSGSGLLGSLLGNSNLGNLVNAVSGLSGLGKSSSSSLMGILAPIVLGVVKRKLLGDDGLNVGGLMDMLRGQKANIRAAMPSDFMRTEEATVSTATERVDYTADRVEQGGSSLLKKLLLPLLLLLGALVLFNLFSGNKQTEETQSMTTEGQTIQREAAAPGDINIANELRNNLSSITQSLSGISDVETAKSALPGIEEATQKIGNLSSMMESVPAPVKLATGKLVSSILPQLQMLSDKLNAIPGVGDVINPVLNTLAANLQAFQ